MKTLLLLFLLAGCATSPKPQYVARCDKCGEQLASAKIVADNFSAVPGGFVEVKTASFHCAKCRKTFLRPIADTSGLHESLAAKPFPSASGK